MYGFLFYIYHLWKLAFKMILIFIHVSFARKCFLVATLFTLMPIDVAYCQIYTFIYMFKLSTNGICRCNEAEGHVCRYKRTHEYDRNEHKMNITHLVYLFKRTVYQCSLWNFIDQNCNFTINNYAPPFYFPSVATKHLLNQYMVFFSDSPRVFIVEEYYFKNNLNFVTASSYIFFLS